MIIEIDRKILKEISSKCVKSDVERVFLGIGTVEGYTVKVAEVVECRNVADDPKTRFVVDPICMYNTFKYAESKGMDIVTIIHSHPAEPKPSSLDIRGMRLWDIPWIIIDMRTGEAEAWILASGRIKKVKIVPI